MHAHIIDKIGSLPPVLCSKKGFWLWKRWTIAQSILQLCLREPTGFFCLFVFCLFFVFNRKWTVSCLMILSKIMEILVNCNYKENIRSIIQANNRGAKSLIEENLDELSWKVTVKVSHSCQTLLYNLIQINYQHT